MIPFLAPFMEARGIGGATQGSLLAFRTALAIVAQPLIGLMADRFGNRARASRRRAGDGGRIRRGAAGAHASRLRGNLRAAGAGDSCSGALLDAGAISELESSGHEPARFSHVRLWGSAGFALAALGFGVAFSGAAKASVRARGGHRNGGALRGGAGG